MSKSVRSSGTALFLALEALVVVAVLAVPGFASLRRVKTQSAAGDAIVRRLTPAQYRQVIADTFGNTIKVGGRFDPGLRQDGLLAVGASNASITASSFEQYDAIAHSIAVQVVSETHRDSLIACAPKSASAPDPACAARFLGDTGRLLFRRSLSEAQLKRIVTIADESAESTHDFYSGLATSLATLLESPQFLFRIEDTELTSTDRKLTAYAKASQLSFLLWNTAPDDELLRAAEDGSLDTQQGLARQVDRMVQSSRLEAGVRAFFSDMLTFDGFETLSKDSTLFPKFTDALAQDAQEQTLRTIVDTVITQNGDYRDLFTTRTSYMTPLLASVYRVPLSGTTSWRRYEFPANVPTAGVLTQISFVGLHSHAGRSSPTLRGRALREQLLCQKVPDPPANIDFSLVQNTDNPTYRTARDRLSVHTGNAACAGCHKLTDPIGLALENFNTIGEERVAEKGAPIDASGELDGITYSDATGLGRAVYDDPALPSCLVNRMYSYMTGQKTAAIDAEWIKAMEKRFARDGYRVVDLLRTMAEDPRSYRAAPSSTMDAAPDNSREIVSR